VTANDVARTAVLHDRHLLWLDAIRSVLERVEIDVVGVASDTPETIELVRALQPDLLVAEDPALLPEAHLAAPGLRSIVVSDLDDTVAVEAAFRGGARAYVLKHAHPDDLATAVRQAFSHSIFMAAQPLAPARPQVSRDVAILTKREREILGLVAVGHSNREVAQQVWVTPQTVKFHLLNVYRKLGVANRTEASRWAYEHGLVAVGLAPVAA
jgi:DNA-binding NarL/FixJ family response regulator